MEQVIKTSTWESAKHRNNNPVTQQYNNFNNKIISNGKAKIGDPDIRALHQGITEPNVFSALNQIENMTIPVGGILMTVENYDPTGVPATERITITLPRQSIQNKGIINIYGKNIQLELGEVLTTVTQKIQSALSQLVDDNIGIDQIHRPNGSQNSLDITYIDTLEHPVIDISDSITGIEIHGEIINNPQPGYGTWDKIGVNNTLVPGTEISIWRRTS